MSKLTIYECNLCRRHIEPFARDIELRGYPMHKTSDSDHLTVAGVNSDCDAHICVRCVESISKLCAEGVFSIADREASR